jgi:CheY-like chemotaxis protein
MQKELEMTKRASGDILLVDDSEDDLELARVALASNWPGCRIIAARDGVEAGDYLYRRRAYAGREPAQPVLVVLDINMPKVSGLELLKTVKSDPALKSIPVVMLTSSREERDIADSYNLGCNAYLVKPLAFDDFQDVIKRMGSFWLAVNELPGRPA